MSAQGRPARDAMRFLLVGVSNAVVAYLVFRIVLLVARNATFRAGAAQLAAYAVGTGWSYYWNRRWTFGSNEPVRQGLTRFVVLQAALAAGTSTALGILVDKYHEPATACWLVVMAGATAVNFAVSRLWVFRGRAAPG